TLPREAREHHGRSSQAAKEAEHPVRALLSTRIKSYSRLLQESALRSFVPAWLAINAVLGLWLNHLAALMVEPGAGNRPNPFPDQLLAGHLAPQQVSWAQGGFAVAFLVGIYIWSHLYGRMRRTDMM